LTHPPLTGGLYVACVTPFDDDEEPDLDAFRSLAEYLIAAGVDGLIVAGTTGEAHALDLDERHQLWDTAVAHADGRVPVLAGTGATTTRRAKQFLRAAAKCGCDGALVLTPWFETPGPDGLGDYYAELAESSGLPVLLYQNPGRTGVTLPHDLIVSLAERFPGRIVGFKDALCDLQAARALRERVPDGFLLFSGGPHEWATFEGVADGSVNDLANAFARESVEAVRGDRDKQRFLAPLAALVPKSANYIALIKAMMRKCGLPAGRPRRPQHRLPEAELEDAARLMAAGGRLAAGAADEYGTPRRSEDAVRLLGPGLLRACIDAGPTECDTSAVCPAKRGDYQYACHASIARFDGRFFAAWSQGRINEDSPGQTVRYATSPDGRSWSKPRPVTPEPEGMRRWTNGGLWLRDGELRCLVVRYDRARYIEGEAAAGRCWEGLATETFRWDGSAWQGESLRVNDLYANEAPRRLPDGRWLLPGVDGRHNVVALLGDVGGWERVMVSERTEALRLTEPSWLLEHDGTLRALLRDDGGSKRLFLAESRDSGDTWTEPVPTDFPDAQAKFFLFRLADGRSAVCCNPAPDETGRRLLAVATAKNGGVFDRLTALRYDPDAAPRLPGMHKDPGFSYPNAVEVGGRLYVIYARNKEDVEVTTVESYRV
jgi:4-hydroxy-tetrahydrodipicolinate synthase